MFNESHYAECEFSFYEEIFHWRKTVLTLLTKTSRCKVKKFYFRSFSSFSFHFSLSFRCSIGFRCFWLAAWNWKQRKYVQQNTQMWFTYGRRCIILQTLLWKFSFELSKDYVFILSLQIPRCVCVCIYEMMQSEALSRAETLTPKVALLNSAKGKMH